MTTDSSGAPALRVLAIPGDGIGQEVVPAALEVLRATGLPLEIAKADAVAIRNQISEFGATSATQTALMPWRPPRHPASAFVRAMTEI